MRDPVDGPGQLYKVAKCLLSMLVIYQTSKMSEVNPLDYIAIKNVLALYCVALDLKDFILLDKVFLPDVIADYPFNSDLKGVQAVRTAIQNRQAYPISP